jgi:hypothetical protein
MNVRCYSPDHFVYCIIKILVGLLLYEDLLLLKDCLLVLVVIQSSIKKLGNYSFIK